MNKQQLELTIEIVDAYVLTCGNYLDDEKQVDALHDLQTVLRSEREIFLHILDNHELRMRYAKQFAKVNEILYLDYTDGINNTPIEKLTEYWFVSEASDQVIYNPFVDESMRFEVDPVKHYGNAFLDSKFYTI